jgi:hypothetical protein
MSLIDHQPFLPTVNKIIQQFENSPSMVPIMHCNMIGINCLTQIHILTYLLNYTSNTPKIVNGKTNINCKMEYYFPIFIFIVNAINNLNISDKICANMIDNFINKKLLCRLLRVHNGNILLQKINRLAHIKTTHDITPVLDPNISYVCLCGTFETFVWWVGFLNNITIPIVSNGLLNRLLSILFKKSPDENILFINLYTTNKQLI